VFLAFVQEAQLPDVEIPLLVDESR
jgi:hypothetical protein